MCDNEEADGEARRGKKRTRSQDAERKRCEYRARAKNKSRPWNEMEEKLFEDAVTTMYEWGDWISVSRIIPTRTKSKKHQVIVWLIDPLLYYSTNKPLFLLSHFLSYTRVLI